MPKKRKRKPGMVWTPALSRSFKNHDAMLAASSLMAQLAAFTSPAQMRKVDATWDRHHQRLLAIDQKLLTIDTQLGILVKMLTMDPKSKMPPAFKLSWAGGRKPRRITPAGMFLRAVLAGVPFSVNGIAYRPVRPKGKKR